MMRLSIANEVDDLLQEILISVHKARHTYDGNRPYKPWVYAIAKFRLQGLDQRNQNLSLDLGLLDDWNAHGEPPVLKAFSW